MAKTRKNNKPVRKSGSSGMDPYRDKDWVGSNTRSEIEGRRIMRNPGTQPNVSNPAILRTYGEAKVAGNNPFTVANYPTGLDTRDTFGEKPSGKKYFTRADVLKAIAKQSQKDAQRRTNLKKKK